MFYATNTGMLFSFHGYNNYNFTATTVFLGSFTFSEQIICLTLLLFISLVFCGKNVGVPG
jgi:hypothetical protein